MPLRGINEIVISLDSPCRIRNLSRLSLLFFSSSPPSIQPKPPIFSILGVSTKQAVIWLVNRHHPSIYIYGATPLLTSSLSHRNCMKSRFRNHKLQKLGFQLNATLNCALNDTMTKLMTQIAINVIHLTAIRLSFLANNKQNGESHTPNTNRAASQQQQQPLQNNTANANNINQLEMGPQSQKCVSMEKRTHNMQSSNHGYQRKKKKTWDKSTLFGGTAFDSAAHCPVCRDKLIGKVSHKAHHARCPLNQKTRWATSKATVQSLQEEKRLLKHFSAPVQPHESAVVLTSLRKM